MILKSAAGKIFSPPVTSHHLRAGDHDQENLRRAIEKGDHMCVRESREVWRSELEKEDVS